jgi:hypothetical protein
MPSIQEDASPFTFPANIGPALCVSLWFDAVLHVLLQNNNQHPAGIITQKVLLVEICHHPRMQVT